MVKPLHAGLAARNGVLAALLAQARADRERAGDRRPAGISARDGQRAHRPRRATPPISAARWEILDTGITVKLYPSCAGTHPTLDALLDLRGARRIHGRRRRAHRDRRGSDRADDPDLRPAGERARGEVQHAVLRRRGGRLRPCRHRHVRRRADLRDPRVAALHAARHDARRSERSTRRAVADAGARARACCKDGRALHAGRATARAAIRRGRRATTSSTAKFLACARASLPKREPRALERCAASTCSTTSDATVQ